MYKLYRPKTDIDRLYVKRKEGARDLLQIEAIYKTEIINSAEYLKAKYIENQFVNIDKSHESSQPNMNLTTKKEAKVAEGLNQSNENSDTNKKGIQHVKAKLGVALKNWKAEQCMTNILEVWIDSLLTKGTRSYGCRGAI